MTPTQLEALVGTTVELAVSRAGAVIPVPKGTLRHETGAWKTLPGTWFIEAERKVDSTPIGSSADGSLVVQKAVHPRLVYLFEPIDVLQVACVIEPLENAEQELGVTNGTRGIEALAAQSHIARPRRGLLNG